MLSAEERRRLDEIERLLQVNDPDFVVRMRAGRPADVRVTRRWIRTVLHVTLWFVVALLGLVGGWRVGLVSGLVAGIVLLVVVALRRGRRNRPTWDIPPFGPPLGPPFGPPLG